MDGVFEQKVQSLSLKWSQLLRFLRPVQLERLNVKLDLVSKMKL